MGRQPLLSPNAAGDYEDTSSGDEEDRHTGYDGERQVQEAPRDPHDTEDGRWTLRPQSATGRNENEQLVLPGLGLRMIVISSLQMRELMSHVHYPEMFRTKYCEFRQLLGNNVRCSHIVWSELKAAEGQDPLIKVAGLAFGVISTPETASYMEEQWDLLQTQFAPHSPDWILARAMKNYALAWAYRPHDLPKAYNIVKAFYDEMENGDPTNFFLTPCYTVTIGRWIYDAHMKCHTLSFPVIKMVEYYADKALRQFRELTDEWARLDLFGMRLNTLLLFLRVKMFYAETSQNTDRLERKIDNLLEELHRCEGHPQITAYDRAGFYSVRKLYYENENDAEYHRCAAISAQFFRENGRMERALEEARLSGDENLVREIEKEAQDVPFD